MYTEQAFDERKWMLAGISLAFAKALPYAESQEKLKILNWLKKIADLTIIHSDKHLGARNNHYYWEGLAVGAVGALTHEQKYQDWSKNIFMFAMKQIVDDGSLPLELARGQRALAYHAFAAAPLVLIASIYNLRSSQLSRLVDFTFRNLIDPQEIISKTNITQVPVSDKHLAWLEVWIRMTPSHAIDIYLSSKRPLVDSDLGGNLTDVANPLEGSVF
jgi:poly(beta-D-mannuronate) lyase